MPPRTRHVDTVTLPSALSGTVVVCCGLVLIPVVFARWERRPHARRIYAAETPGSRQEWGLAHVLNPGMGSGGVLGPDAVTGVAWRPAGGVAAKQLALASTTSPAPHADRCLRSSSGPCCPHYLPPFRADRSPVSLQRFFPHPRTPHLSLRHSPHPRTPHRFSLRFCCSSIHNAKKACMQGLGPGADRCGGLVRHLGVSPGAWAVGASAHGEQGGVRGSGVGGAVRARLRGAGGGAWK